MNDNIKIVPSYILKRRTILSFICFFFFIALAFTGWKLLKSQPMEDEALVPLRRGLDANEWLFSNMFSSKKLSKEYAKKFAAARVRVNGDVGLKNKNDTANWNLQLIKNINETQKINLATLKKLPKTVITFDFKCIEGWNQITNWGGVKFSDFVKKYSLTAQTNLKYVGLTTPDSTYYVGIDMASMMHPQTILAYEMNGMPLPMNQGFPLRLIIPVKYGVKHIKRIGNIFFSDTKPKDYWYEMGYDYFSGL